MVRYIEGAGSVYLLISTVNGLSFSVLIKILSLIFSEL